MSSARRVGLPETLRMRHDSHFVEQLARPGGVAIGRLVPIEDLMANPHQPRQVMGDLSELMASVAEKGIIEPLIVRQRLGRYQIIAGERRYHAAVQVGLREVPVVIREVDDAEVMELALVENLQRKDLTAFEDEMRQAKVDWTLIKYGGAVHSFTQPMAGNDNSKGAAYNEKADRRSWKAMELFLAGVLK